jgi:hypothetical protein
MDLTGKRKDLWIVVIRPDDGADAAPCESDPKRVPAQLPAWTRPLVAAVWLMVALRPAVVLRPAVTLLAVSWMSKVAPLPAALFRWRGSRGGLCF